MEEWLTNLLKQSVLLVFFVFFAGVIWWAVRMPESEVERLSLLPLASDDNNSAQNGGPTHG